MMLTTKSRYAVMAIVDVASKNAPNPTRLSEISARQNIPLNYLEQIFPKLKKANIVTARKGPGGGYNLNKEHNNLYILNIIDAVNENIKMTRCSKENFCTKVGKKCKTHDLWFGLSNQIRSYLASISIEDVINGKININ